MNAIHLSGKQLSQSMIVNALFSLTLSPSLLGPSPLSSSLIVHCQRSDSCSATRDSTQMVVRLRIQSRGPLCILLQEGTSLNRVNPEMGSKRPGEGTWECLNRSLLTCLQECGLPEWVKPGEVLYF